MGDVDLAMIWKRLEEVQAGQAALFAEVREFRAETGQTPARAVENLRIEAARLMLESGRHPVDTVARDTGFGDRNRMRRAFLRAFGQSPQMIRRTAAR